MDFDEREYIVLIRADADDDRNDGDTDDREEQEEEEEEKEDVVVVVVVVVVMMKRDGREGCIDQSRFHSVLHFASEMSISVHQHYSAARDVFRDIFSFCR